MTIQDILLELSAYNVDCRINGEWFLIGLKFKKDWQILQPSNPLIEFVENEGIQYYGAPLKDVSFDEVFECIKETIEHNKDLEKRVILFQEKVTELQEIFKKEDYKTLKTLEFKFKKPKENKERKKSTEKQPSQPNKVESVENVVEENTEVKEKRSKKSTATKKPRRVEENYDDICYVDTIAEMTNNKLNENNYLNS